MLSVHLSVYRCVKCSTWLYRCDGNSCDDYHVKLPRTHAFQPPTILRFLGWLLRISTQGSVSNWLSVNLSTSPSPSLIPVPRLCLPSPQNYIILFISINLALHQRNEALSNILHRMDAVPLEPVKVNIHSSIFIITVVLFQVPSWRSTRPELRQGLPAERGAMTNIEIVCGLSAFKIYDLGVHIIRTRGIALHRHVIPLKLIRCFWVSNWSSVIWPIPYIYSYIMFKLYILMVSQSTPVTMNFKHVHWNDIY